MKAPSRTASSVWQPRSACRRAMSRVAAAPATGVRFSTTIRSRTDRPDGSVVQWITPSIGQRVRTTRPVIAPALSCTCSTSRAPASVNGYSPPSGASTASAMGGRSMTASTASSQGTSSSPSRTIRAAGRKPPTASTSATSTARACSWSARTRTSTRGVSGRPSAPVVSSIGTSVCCVHVSDPSPSANARGITTPNWNRTRSFDEPARYG